MNELRTSLFEAPHESRSEQSRRSGRRGWLTATVLAGIVAVGVAGYVVAGDVAAPAPAQAAQAAPAGVPVTVATVERRDSPVWTDFSGRMEAVGRVAVRPRVQGPIVAAHFHEGALVHRGDLLFTIDPEPYQAEVDRLEAQLSAAAARLLLADRQQKRGIQLGGLNDLARSDVDARINEYRAAEANVRAAAASLRTAQLNLSYTEVRAPITGRAGRIEVTPGNLVDAGAAAPVLTTLVSVDPIYASFDADERSVADAVSGLPPGGDLADAIAKIPVRMGTLNAEGTPFTGRLQLVDNLVDTGSGTVRVRAVFDNADGHLMPGQFARLRLGRAKPEPSIAIDERAIGTDQDRRFVMVVGADNTVSVRQVVLGPDSNGLRIVTAGLNPGERIVVDGLQRVRPGSLVAPTEANRADLSGGRTALAAQ